LRFLKCVKKYTSFAQVRLGVSKNIQVLHKYEMVGDQSLILF